ncbi:MAG: sigma-70 family RNA polymerase sigma factor [Verrucomicrobia bacterium]|nr:sigma-70 family RNA polymerase sigma factor [Verrucomicrobiota bacterium]
MSAVPNEIESRQRLVSLWTRHQRQIFGYILALIPSRHDADDILQETGLVVCSKFDDFVEGTDFVAWACQIAWWQVRSARQKFARSKVIFDNDVLEAAAPQFALMAREVDARHEALGNCLQKLHARDRELVLTRYERGHGVEEAAKRSGRTMEAAYRALNRIRKLLADCVTYQLSQEGAQ